MGSWKTSALGIATLIGIAARIASAGHADPADITAALSAIGLLFAKDHAAA